MKTTPKYMDIVEWTKEQIAMGSFEQGKKFFSESMLGELFGCSRQTVRRALEELEQMSYINRVKGSGTYISNNQPNIKFEPLVPGSLSRVIGIISTHLDSYIFPSIIQGIENVLNTGGYTTLVTSTKNLVEGEIKALKLMLERRLDGIIVEPTKSGLPCINKDLYLALSQRGIPVVFIDSFYSELNAPYVALDDLKAGYTACKHLIDMGHRNIIGIFTHSDRQGQLRYQGYAKALLEHGYPLRDDYIFWYSKENMLQILNNIPLDEILTTCTAALCYNDTLAISLINLLRQKGRHVPEDFSVVSIDNSEVAQIHSLTSIIHPSEELGEAAAKLLLSMINGEEGKNTLFPPKLITRGSVSIKEAIHAINQ